ncbi:RHS repeat domain-containing protein [Aquimarina pacifica]|uniref:RHS repeat domain-containing protein n=1 Tax=Aquimarina pacifica TaxID=1296415 RepID=UPI000472A7AB|nr:RHS repeat-associated core domain-containing protein [Aquimarina pacifica]
MRKYLKIIVVLGSILCVSNVSTAQNCIELETPKIFTFNSDGGEDDVKLDSYIDGGPSTDCYLANTDQAYVEIEYIGASTPEGWLSAWVSYYENDELGDTEYYLTVRCNSITTPNSRSARLFIYDGNGNRVTYRDDGISVSQSKGDLEYWYPDEDGDGLGYSSTVPIMATSPPYTGWITNGNWNENGIIQDDQGDFCPYIYGEIDGCPEGIPDYSYNQNLVVSKSYDIQGDLKGHTVDYFDALAKPNKTMSKDFKNDKVWMSETFYDYQNRMALQTLSAPTRFNKIEGDYKLSYISITDYEKEDIENPKVITDTTEGRLGWYYNTSNTTEPYQDVTARPYSRIIYSELNPGKVLKTIGGNKINGEWKQGYTFSMPAGQELSHADAFGDTKYNPEHYKIIKTVSRDVHGIESVVFTDTDGKTLAAARSGNEEGNVDNTRTSIVSIGAQGFVDVHIPVGRTGVTLSGNSGITLNIYNLITETKAYNASTLSNGFYRIAVQDVDNYVAGQITVTYPENYYDYSLNYYDEAGHLLSTQQPLEKLESTFSYNSLGQLESTTSIDEGSAQFKYRNDGQIRYSQNSKQADAGEFSYTNYDDLGRPIESGVLVNSNFSNADPDAGLPSGTTKEVHKTTYDYLENTSFLPGDYENLKFLAGNVAKTENDQTTTYYSYDIYGRVEFMVQIISGLGTKTIDYEYDDITGLVTKVYYQKGENTDQFIHKYRYDDDDYSLIKVETSNDDTTFTEHASYTYYETGALKRVNIAEGLQGIDYVYNLNGALKSINHPSLSSDHDPGGDTNDLFGMIIDYHDYDFNRPLTNIKSADYGINQYNGNIKGIRWNSDYNPLETGKEHTYNYVYNRNNYLKSAEYGNFTGDYTSVPTIIEGVDASGSAEDDDATYSGTVSAGNSLSKTVNNSISLKPGFHGQSGCNVSLKIDGGNDTEAVHDINAGTYTPNIDGDYKVDNLTYDANGNIQSLDRNKHTDENGNTMDQLSYVYKNDKPNQLLRVDDAVTTATNADDIKDQDGENYVYNEIGQLIHNHEENISYFYNASGLVTEVHKDNVPLVKFFYNDKNHRVRKESYNPENGSLTYTEHYVRDAAGTAMAIYRDGALVENTIYGASRLGVRKADDTHLYQLTDHLGNVRAVVGRDQETGIAIALSATDYYPFGMPMPGRDLKGDYRYAYQGQEKDPETGKEAFELRLWDSRIGRWLTTDPYGQFSSPYLGMGNNPMNGIDPDGGFFGGYKLAGNGDITRISDEGDDIGVDYLYNEDLSSKVMLSDQLILSTLTFSVGMGSYNGESKNFRATFTSNFKDASTFFSFASDNSNVEWGFHGNSNSGNEYYFLGSFGVTDLSPNPANSSMWFNWNSADTSFKIHSHPNTDYPDPTGDWGIGDMNSSWMQRKIFGKVKYSPTVMGDMGSVVNRYYKSQETGQKMHRSFHYFPNGGLYEYTPWSSRVFISKGIYRNRL